MAIDLHIADAVTTRQGQILSPKYDLPTNVQEGDLLFLLVNVKSGNLGDGIDTSPADLTQKLAAIDNATWSSNHHIFWKIAESTDETRATFDFTLKDDHDSSAIALRITGYDSVTPLGNSNSLATSSDVTSITVPSIDSTDGNVVILSGGLGGFSTTVDSMVKPADFGDLVEIPKAATSDIGSHLASKLIVSTGATGDKEWTWTEAQPAGASLVEINAATGPVSISGTVQNNTLQDANILKNSSISGDIDNDNLFNVSTESRQTVSGSSLTDSLLSGNTLFKKMMSGSSLNTTFFGEGTFDITFDDTFDGGTTLLKLAGLIGTATNNTSLDGVLAKFASTSKPLSGSVLSSSSMTGVVAISISLSGTAYGESSSDGMANLAISVSGSVLTAVGTEGAINELKTLTGSTATVTRLDAELSTDQKTAFGGTLSLAEKELYVMKLTEI